jgi:O-antigen ligase
MLYWVFPFPPIIWRVGLILLSLYVLFLEKSKFLPCEITVLVFSAFNLFHFFISYLWQNPSTTQIGDILCAMLSLSIFVCLSQKRVMTDLLFTVVGIILLACAILNYYHFQSEMLSQKTDDIVNITNNATESFLMLLPMLFLLKNNIQKWISLFVCIFFLVMGAKRGNIIAAMIPIGLFVYGMLRNSRHSAKKILFVLVLVAGFIFFTYRWVVTNDYLMYRVEQTITGDSSGRDVLYFGAWHSWFDSNNIIIYLFGYGFDGTRHQSLTYYRPAHNDWLEVLVDYGLVGIILYICVFVTLVKQIKKTQSVYMKLLLLSVSSIWFFKSLYSMGFLSESLSVLMISMGTALGNYKVEEKA